MLHFFRKIRKALLPESRFGRYFIYAIGEIVLVVIGILIALSINNWNQNQKDRILERSILENLAGNLENNCKQLESRIESISWFRKSGNIVLSVLDDGESIPDSLYQYMHFALMNTSDINISQVGYEFLKNTGFEIIRNDPLKKEIILFFEETQPRFLKSLTWGDIDKTDREKFIDEQFIQSFDEKLNKVIYTPFYPNSLLKNNYFRALVKKTDIQRDYFTIAMNKQLDESKIMLKAINSELNTLN